MGKMGKTGDLARVEDDESPDLRDGMNLALVLVLASTPDHAPHHLPQPRVGSVSNAVLSP
jgi:hypothetical protein